MKFVIIDDQKGEAEMLVSMAKHRGLAHEISIVWQIDSVQHAATQALVGNPDAIFVDWEFCNWEYPIPDGVDGGKIVTALRQMGYEGPIYSHSSSGMKNFEKAGLANLMELDATNKRADSFTRIVSSLGIALEVSLPE